MEKQIHGQVSRLLMSLAAAAALSGCAVYAPPYAAYDAAPVAAPYYSAYPYYYGYPYGYGVGGSAYVAPPLSLNFGYYRHGYRGGGHRDHGWRGGYGGRGPGWGGGRGHGGRGGGGHGRR